MRCCALRTIMKSCRARRSPSLGPNRVKIDRSNVQPVGLKSFAKTRTPPESKVAGGVSGTLIWWVYGGLSYEGSASANARVRLSFLTQRRARRVPGGATAVWPGDLDGFGFDIREPPTDGSPIA